MANITLLGASYTDVPAVDLPQTGGGTVRFYENGGGGGTPAISVVDTTDSHGGTIREITALDISDTTATAPDVAQGKYFYTAQGVKTAGAASGGGSSVQTVTGTVSGSGTNTLQIPCDFAPDLIYVYGDMTGDASLRGCVSFTIVKDTYLETTVDGSSNNTDEQIWWINHNITGYSTDTSLPYGTYSNGVVTLDMVENSSALRFNSAVTYTYKFVKWTS